MNFATILMTIGVLADSACRCDGRRRPRSLHRESHPETRIRRYDWPMYGGTSENNHFSPLNQINRNNVKQLRSRGPSTPRKSGGLQTSPIVVDGVLYGLTPSQKVFALNAATGKLLWKFDSGIKGTQPDRGLAYWADSADRKRG